MIPFAANAGLYGLAVFVAIFVAEMIQVSVLTPQVGLENGMLLGFAVKIAAVTLIARFVVTKLEPGADVVRLIVLGALGTVVLVMFEGAFATMVLGQPFDGSLRSYDMSRGGMFPIGLAVVLLAPLTILVMEKAFGGKAGGE